MGVGTPEVKQAQQPNLTVGTDTTTASREELDLADREFKELHKMLPEMRLNEKGILDVRFSPQRRPSWCTTCRRPLRKEVIWLTHSMTHSGINKTVNRIRLSWYWARIVSDVREAILACEVCQMTKKGGLPSWREKTAVNWESWVEAGGRHGEAATGDRKKEPMAVDHFTRWQDTIAITNTTTPL